jgi:hypothetical protein
MYHSWAAWMGEMKTTLQAMASFWQDLPLVVVLSGFLGDVERNQEMGACQTDNPAEIAFLRHWQHHLHSRYPMEGMEARGASLTPDLPLPPPSPVLSVSISH